MTRDLIGRYIWIIDTVRRYKRITREELDACWIRSVHSNGEKLSRRTFYNYRHAIAETFGIVIECDSSTFEYYIARDGGYSESVTDWLLNSMATNSAISGASDVSGRIFVEDVPSARDFLSVFINALKENAAVRFTYRPYSRINPTPGIELEPYLLKIFKQRWYVAGRNVKDNRIKTYALDRMSDVTVLQRKFEMPADFEPEHFFDDSFGIVVDYSEPRRIALRTDSRKAKYLRALPLHKSQWEAIHDSYSIFYYNMRITQDFVQELLSHGAEITVIEPPELKAMIVSSLKASLANYETPANVSNENSIQ